MVDDIKLSAEQTEAVELVSDINVRIACVTGQAGTGKTTILRQAYSNVVDKFASVITINERGNEAEVPGVVLCAPTGRAAARIEEATGIPAMTIHRMMRFNMPTMDDAGNEIPSVPAYSKILPMPYDMVFVDEASMVDEELYRKVVDALKRGARIRFFGDNNQLPPIQGKSPFAQGLKKHPSVVLTENFRSNDGIIAASDAVIRNKIPVSGEKVLIRRCERTMGMTEIMKIAESHDFTSMDAQIIAPTRANKNGAMAINVQMQTRFNPSKRKLTIFRTEYFKGESKTVTTAFKPNDKVIWTKNDYNLGLFNGQIGRLIDWDEDDNMIVNFEGKDCEIPYTSKRYNPYKQSTEQYDPRTQMDLAYAITTHKSQGSQFSVVMYALAYSRAATRQNVYTAITRAKDQIVIVNIGGYLSDAIMNKVKID
jgi:exodeoxyribonuclease V alpha subunit